MRREFARTLLEQLLDIVKDLQRAGVVHRDLRPHNLLVVGEHKPQLVLIDWASAVWQDVSPEPGDEELLRQLGGQYKPAAFRWDDAFAARIIAKQLDPNETELELHQQFQECLGRRVIRYDAHARVVRTE